MTYFTHNHICPACSRVAEICERDWCPNEFSADVCGCIETRSLGMPIADAEDDLHEALDILAGWDTDDERIAAARGHIDLALGILQSLGKDEGDRAVEVCDTPWHPEMDEVEP